MPSEAVPKKEELGKILETVTDEMLEGLQVISRDFRYLYVNETVAKQGKSTKDALLGRTMTECYPGIDKTPFWIQLRKCMEERLNIRMENEFAFPDKSVGWFELLMHPVTEGALILSIDITRKKRAEAELSRKIDDLDELMQIAVGREMKMAELKTAVAHLKGLLPSLGGNGPMDRE